MIPPDDAVREAARALLARVEHDGTCALCRVPQVYGGERDHSEACPIGALRAALAGVAGGGALTPEQRAFYEAARAYCADLYRESARLNSLTPKQRQREMVRAITEDSGGSRLHDAMADAYPALLASETARLARGEGTPS